MSNYKCTELLKNGNRSLVEIKNLNTNAISYVVCNDFDNSKTYGNKWAYESEKFYLVNESAGLYQQEQLKAATLDLYDIKEPKVSYDRLLELSKKILATGFNVNNDIDIEHLRDMGFTEDEAELFGIKEQLFQKKYKIVEATFVRKQYVTVKTIMPEDAYEGNVDDYVENQEYLGDQCTDDEDWELDNYLVKTNDLTAEEIEARYDFDDLWNGCDLPNID